MNWIDVQFVINRTTGLFRRGLQSLRTRGLTATWKRIKKQFRHVPVAQRARLYLPEAQPWSPFAVPATGPDRIPMASIVVPVFNHCEHTLTCLRALAAHPPQASIEVIVVDDGSSDDTQAWLSQVTGLRYHRRIRNGGFIAACNDGLALARGEYVVFLNNDTVPQPGWLDALLQTFDDQPDTGIAGSQLLYPDGRLQESGGVVWQDGSADKLGHLQAADAPPFNHTRRVDYVSGAALAMPRELCLRLEGFDPQYAPAFYEDTDLAMRVRAAGLHVLVQPASRVVHLEGVTTGTDERQGVKSHQPVNQARFAARWSSTLPSHPLHATDMLAITDHHYRRTALIIDALTPQPDRDSGSLRLFNLMRLLVNEGVHVVFLPANHAYEGRYTQDLQRLGVETWFAPFSGNSPAWMRKHGSRFDAAIVSRHYVASEFLPMLRKHAPRARVVFDTVDLHYLREQRGAELSGDTTLARAAAHTRTLELDLINRSDLTLVVSQTERNLLATDAPAARVEVLSNLHRISGPGQPFPQRRDIVFVGGFRHPPNVDAVQWFVSSVFPLIQAKLPDVRFHCIGGDVPDEIASLVTRPGVMVHGHVPDITPYMDGARIAVAPLRYGAGVKGKVNLSMAHGQPVVATACAVEGMHLRAGEDVLVADSAQTFADAVLQLYGDEALWQRLATNGMRNVEQHFSLDAGREVVRRVLLA